MNIINDWQNKQLRCHFCGETRSVKYELKIRDVESNLPKTVCACNLCALKHSGEEVQNV